MLQCHFKELGQLTGSSGDADVDVVIGSTWTQTWGSALRRRGRGRGNRLDVDADVGFCVTETWTCG